MTPHEKLVNRPLTEILPDRPPKRYLRSSTVVFVRELSEDAYLISDKEDRNEYLVSREVFQREYEEI